MITSLKIKITKLQNWHFKMHPQFQAIFIVVGSLSSKMCTHLGLTGQRIFEKLTSVNLIG